MRDFPEGFYADRLLRRVLAPPAPGVSPPRLASTPVNPKAFSGPRRPAAARPHPPRPILLVRLKARS